MGLSVGIRYLMDSGTYIWDQSSHLSEVLTLIHRPHSVGRSQVSKGMRVGLVGGTPDWTPHLHYEMKRKPVTGVGGPRCGQGDCFGYVCNPDPTVDGYLDPKLFMNSFDYRVLLPDFQGSTFGQAGVPSGVQLHLRNIQRSIGNICLYANRLSDQSYQASNCTVSNGSQEQIHTGNFTLKPDDYTVHGGITLAADQNNPEPETRSTFRPIFSVLPGPDDVIRDNHFRTGPGGVQYFKSSSDLNDLSETSDGYLFGSFISNASLGVPSWASWHPHLTGGPYEIWAFIGGGGSGSARYEVDTSGAVQITDPVDFGGSPYRWVRLTRENGTKTNTYLSSDARVYLEDSTNDRLLFDAIKFVKNQVGYYADSVSGWNSTASPAFVAAYERNGGPEALGYPVSHYEGGQFVHRWEPEPGEVVWIQDLQQTTQAAKWPDGRTALILNGFNAFLLKEGFWNYYMNNQGPSNLGAPTSDEFVQGGVTYQNFAKGKLAWSPNAPGNGIGHYDLNGELIRGHGVTFVSSRPGTKVWNRGALLGEVPATMTGCEGCRYTIDVELPSSGLNARSGSSNLQYKLAVANGPMTVDLDELIESQTSSGVISAPNGTLTGNVAVSANVSDADGLTRVTVTFRNGGTPLVLCGSGGPSACSGTTQSLSRTNINPANYGASAGTVTLRLFVEDTFGNTVETDTHSFNWSPTGTGSSHTLTITKLGNGSGTISGNGIYCGPDCTSASATYPDGTQVTLTGTGDQFIGFMGNLCFGMAPCTFAMHRDQQIEAAFSLPDSLGVAYTYPSNGDNGVSTGTIRNIYFNRSIQLGPNSNNIVLSRCDSSDPRVATPAIGGLSNERLTLHDTGALDKQTCYTVRIPAGAVSDLSGNPLSAPYVFSFTTETLGAPKMYVDTYPSHVPEGTKTKISVWFETPTNYWRVLYLTSTPADFLLHSSELHLPPGETLIESEVYTRYDDGSLLDVSATIQVQEAEAGTFSTNISVFNTTSSDSPNLMFLNAGMIWDDDGDGVFESNERADILFEVANLGSQGISNVVLDFYTASNGNLKFAGTAPYTCQLGYIGPRDYGECTATLRADKDLPTGSYYIKVHGSGTTSSGTQHMHASQPINITNRSQPDYTINASPFSTSPRQPGAEASLRYHPRNSGDGFDARLPKFEIFLEIDGQEHKIHSLHANARGDLDDYQTYDLKFTVPAVPGSHKIKARINADGAIPESNSTNNEANVLILNIAAPNQAPDLPTTIGPFIANIGQLTTISTQATDPNNDPLTYSLGPGAPAGLSIHSTSGLITWTPDCAIAAQTYNVEVRVSDGRGLSDSGIVIIEARRVADLAVTASSNLSLALPGQTVEIDVEVKNNGPSCLTGAAVTASISPEIAQLSWTCTATSGSTCLGSGTGGLTDSVSLASGGAASYSLLAKIADTANGLVSNQFSVALPANSSDSFLGNNGANASISLRGLDFGDAGDNLMDPAWSFPTRIVDNGARHGVDPLFVLGNNIDSESDGIPSEDAVGDDLSAADDENGVVFLESLVTCEAAAIEVTVSDVGKLDAWIDFNSDGDWSDSGEQVFAAQPLVAGANSLSVNIPCSAKPAAVTFSRFRLSRAGGLGFAGLAEDGEVEDYGLPIRGFDFGDAPSPFPTALAGNGAHHLLTSGGPVLGSRADAEADGQPDPLAIGDDQNGPFDDEDGIELTAPLVPGSTASVTVITSAPAKLDAWIDFNGDGDWTDAEEQIFTSRNIPTTGINTLTFPVPGSALWGLSTFGRFRLSSSGGLTPLGMATDGEVEDLAVSIASCQPPATGDWVLTASCTYNRTLAAPANVIVEPGVVLTIEPGAILEIDLHTYKLLVRQGGGVLVRQGGTVRQTSGTLNP